MRLPGRAIALSFLLTLPANAVWAVGTEEEDATNPANYCEKGTVWDKKEEKCVPEDSASLDDSDFLHAGTALAYAGLYEEAIALLRRVSDDASREKWNMLGYATRKSGSMEEGVSYYRKALDIDPDYTLARAYMGEALLTAGDRPAALVQLAEIETREGRDTRAWVYLKKALDGGYSY